MPLLHSWDRAEDRDTELREVMIEGEGVRDVQAFHHRETRGIGGEVLVVVLVDDRTRPLLVFRADADECRAAAIEFRKEPDCSCVTKAREEEGMRFRDDEVRREEPGRFTREACEDGIGRRMVRIAVSCERIVGR